jgi:hypothetical protein
VDQFRVLHRRESHCGALRNIVIYCAQQKAEGKGEASGRTNFIVPREEEKFNGDKKQLRVGSKEGGWKGKRMLNLFMISGWRTKARNSLL